MAYEANGTMTAALLDPYPSPNTPSAIPSSTLGCVSSASASFQMTRTVGFLAPLGGYEDGEEYVRLCVEESLEPCRLTTASIANMCGCLAYQSRHLPGWEDSLAKLFLDRIMAAAIVAARPDPLAVEWEYRS